MFSGFTRPASASRVFHSSSSPLDDILNREDIVDVLSNSDGAGQRAFISYVERNLPRLLAASQRPASKEQTLNAAVLLVHFIQTHPNQSDAIRKIVPSTVSLLSRKGILAYPVAAAFQRILIASFEVDFSQTSYSVNIALCDEVVHGAIRNLASNGVIGETLIALFGSALSASTMMLPSTTPNIFTDVWIKHGFPFHVAAYCKVAMSSMEFLPYFSLMQELYKRGLSHSAGPIIDGIVSNSSFGEILEAVLDCCESSESFPLAADGMQMIVSILALMRKTFPPTENAAQYLASVAASAPLSLVLTNLKRLEWLLSPRSSNCVGLCRLAVLDAVLEIVQFVLKDADDALIESNIITTALSLWQQFPNNDFVCRGIEKLFLFVCSRRTLPDLCDVLHSHYVFGSQAVMFLDVLVSCTCEPKYRATSLQAAALGIAIQLHELPLFTSGSRKDGFFSKLVQVDCAERVHQWMSAITGAAFGNVGSGCPGFVPVHRPPRNPMNLHVVADTSDFRDDDHMPVSSSTSATSVASDKGSKYKSTFDVVADDDDQPSTAATHFQNPFDDEDDDAVNIDDADTIEPIQGTDSVDRFDDDQWVEQTIQDVNSAIEK